MPDIFKSNLATNSTDTVYTSSSPLLAADEDRQYAIICNTSSTPIYLGLGQAAVVGSGIKLHATGTYPDRYVIDRNNLFNGIVYAITTPAGSASFTHY